jgi:hypothetical protein
MKDSERIVNHGKHVKAMVDEYEKENNEHEEVDAAAAKRGKTEAKPIARPGPKDRAGLTVTAPIIAVAAEKVSVTVTAITHAAPSPLPTS